MPVQIACPNPQCRAAATVGDETIGRQARCRRCGQVFPVVARPAMTGATPRTPTTPLPAAVAVAPTTPRRSGPSHAGSTSLPERFGRYRIVGRLGQGGMGAVYLAHDEKLDRQVALKVPFFGPDEGPEALARFGREAHAAAVLDHPNLCPVHDVGEVDGIPYLTMPYLEGETLAAALAGGRTHSPAGAAALVRKLALALRVAHDRGITHRDLKPGNILIDPHRELVIMDFGLARHAAHPDSGLTREGMALGTALYMAPEQAAGDLAAIGPRSDIYSLGVILYELLAGVRPFEGPWSLVIGLKCVQDPAPPSQHRPDLPPALDALCLRALARDPGARFASMAEFAAALKQFLAAPAGPAAAPAEAPSPGPETLEKQFVAALVAGGPISLRDEPRPKAKATPAPQPDAGVSRPWRRRPIVAAALVAAATSILVGLLVVAFRPGSRPGPGKPARPGGVAATIPPPDKPSPTPAAAEATPPSPPPAVAEGAEPAGEAAPLNPPPTPPRATEVVEVPSFIPTPAVVAPDPIAAEFERGRWTTLFNGKDLTGWKRPASPKGGGNGGWQVRDGILVGSGAGASILYSERKAFRDFHLRVEARFSEGEGGAIGFRTGTAPVLLGQHPQSGDYEALINSDRGDQGATGALSLIEPERVWAVDNQVRVGPGRWFTLDLIVDGFRMATLVDGELKAIYLDRKMLHPAGHLALRQRGGGTLEFRRIEVEDLRRPGRKDPREVDCLVGHEHQVGMALFGAGDRSIVSGGHSEQHWFHDQGYSWNNWWHDNTVRYWDSKPGGNATLQTAVPADHVSRVTALAISADGRHVASYTHIQSGKPATIRPILYVWKGGSTVAARRFELDAEAMKDRAMIALGFSGDGRHLRAGCSDGTVLAWDWAADKGLPNVPLKGRSFGRRELTSMAFAAGGRLLIAGSRSGLVEAWDLTTGESLQSFIGHTGRVVAVAGSVDGRRLLSLDASNNLRAWDLDTGRTLWATRQEGAEATCVAISPDGRRGLTGGLDGPVHAWDVDAGKEVARLQGHTLPVLGVALSRDGARGLSCGGDGTIRLWKVP